MFEKKDQAFFESTLDRIENLAETLGLNINRKSRVALKMVTIFLALATIGSLFFIFTLIKRSIVKKN